MVKFILGRSSGVLFGPPLVGFRGVLRGIEGNRARNSNRPESLNSGLLIFLGVIGRGDWIRTSDPLRPRQVRYQAALRPDSTDYPTPAPPHRRTSPLTGGDVVRFRGILLGVVLRLEGT